MKIIEVSLKATKWVKIEAWDDNGVKTESDTMQPFISEQAAMRFIHSLAITLNLEHKGNHVWSTKQLNCG